MSDQLDEVIATSVMGQEQGAQLLEKLVAVARPGMVHSASRSLRVTAPS